MEKLKLSIDEAGNVSGESRPVMYDAIKAGHLKTFLVRRRRVTRPAYLRQWIDFLEAESAAGRPVSSRSRPKVAA